MRRSESNSNGSSTAAPSATTKARPAISLSAPVLIGLVVILLALGLNLSNLVSLTTDHSSTHDYHNEIISALLRFHKSALLDIRIKDDDIELDDDNVLDEIEKAEDVMDADESIAIASGHMDEVHAFKSILSRAVATLEVCNGLPKLDGPPAKTVPNATDVPMLAEFGIINALSEWIGKAEDEKRHNGDGEPAYPLCHLPPPTSCNTTSYSAILMSHAAERLKKLMSGISDLAKRQATQEIILVWNSPRSILEADRKGRELLAWDKDPAHKMRIFFALENGLQNNLLNRYHPSINPKSEAIMYFDDDGPFFSERAMSQVGLELWRRNSDVQNAAFPRNLRVLSDRMKFAQKEGMEVHLKSIRAAGGADSSLPDGEVPFTPTCRERTGDIIEYNYFVFPQFGANMALPSGSIIHRNYLCFIWHPAFEELRQFILDHPTHPDDQTVSAMISQLSGKPPRAFPRNVQPAKEEPAGATAAKQKRRRLSLVVEEENELKSAWSDQGVAWLNTSKPQNMHVDRYHRRLLWQQENWAQMREEAANSVIGYFGSLNAGSVGWCAGTDHQKKRPRAAGGYDCDPEKPTLDLIPWIKPGGFGYDICQ